MIMEPLPRRTPLWSIALITDLADGGAAVVVVVVLHHVLAGALIIATRGRLGIPVTKDVRLK